MTRHAGVVGSPITHSLSPVLHRAAYDALSLQGWTFHRDEVAAGDLAAYVRCRPPDWVGLAVTMPLKEEALVLGDSVGEEARLVGGANTLVRAAGAWRAENTDVYGLVTALREAGVSGPRAATLVGSGATARSALLALHRLGVDQVQLLVRDRVRPGALELAEQLGMVATTRRYADGPGQWAPAGLVVNTVPAGGTPPVEGWRLEVGAVVFDVVYAGWPTPWARDWAARGVDVTRGDRMLLHQAVRQVELMTGRPAPVAAMTQALAGAVGT